MPLSADFYLVPISSIVIPRDERQRRELNGLEDLAESIKQVGLINPLVVTREDLVLVAGERRLEALKILKVEYAPVQYLDTLDPLERRAIELEENIKRQPLTWQENNKAIFDYHVLRSAQAKEYGKSWSIEDTARELSITEKSVDRHLWVRREINRGRTEVAEAQRFSAALGICQRAFERDASEEADTTQVVVSETQRGLEEALDLPPVEEDLSILGRANPSHTSPPDLDWSVRTQDFLTSAVQYSGPRFNFIHFDPPYGVNRHKSGYSEAGASAWEGGYEDDPEQFDTILGTFLKCQDKLCQASCHLMLWFSMNYYADTVHRLGLYGWKVVPHPLIWNKVSTGIASDPRRRPRHVYETALLASRGDRPIIRPLADIVTFQPSRNRHHYSEKPQEMLEEFFKMFIDGSSVLLDPTCGAGSALRAALALGARRVEGWDISEDSIRTATNLLRRQDT